MKVTILDGCIACGACESVCSAVFTVTDIAHVDQSMVEDNEIECRVAAEACPVNVIKIED